MAMKVSKTVIHRLTVEMSCGCQLYSEFKDAQCKEPFNATFVEGTPCPMRHFFPCQKHATDASVYMLEFIIGERLDEAVEAAQKAPAQPLHQFSAPGAVDIQSTLLSGDTVQSVMLVKPEIRQRARPEDPTKVKTLNRGVGGGTQSTGMELDMDGAEEDELISGDVEDVLAGLSELDKDDERQIR